MTTAAVVVAEVAMATTAVGRHVLVVCNGLQFSIHYREDHARDDGDNTRFAASKRASLALNVSVGC